MSSIVENYYFPDDIWGVIKGFQLDWIKAAKRHHKLNSVGYLNDLDGLYGIIYERWMNFPPYDNTTALLRYDYFYWRSDGGPEANLPLVSLTTNGIGKGCWAGYGWKRYNKDFRR